MRNFRNSQSIRVGLIVSTIAVTVAIGRPGYASDAGSPGAGQEAQAGDEDWNWWRTTRASRQAAIDAYVARNAEGFDAFRSQPIATKQDFVGVAGMPVIVFRLLTEIFPDIWGPPEQEMLVIGFGPDPFDPETVMPLGTGFALSAPREGEPPINYMNLTCMGCHAGTVVGPDGTLLRQIGGSTSLRSYFDSIHRTVTDPRYTADNFRDALDRKPAGWLYGDDPELLAQEELERKIFGEPGGAERLLAEIQRISVGYAARFAETVGAHTYNRPDAPAFEGMPGSFDVFSFTAHLLSVAEDFDDETLRTVLPPAPGPTDIPAAWRQVDRARFQWDNSIGSAMHREISTALIASAAVDPEGLLAGSSFVDELPAAPYPFDVRASAVAQGESLFRQACAGCHIPGNEATYSPEETGTSPNRANVFTEWIGTWMRTLMGATCTIPECFDANGDPLSDEQIFEATGGYGATSLAGIWQTAPYLHNGSVPTLYHLLTGDRPDTFYRGNFSYDQGRVGYTWDEATDPRAVRYDTSLSGYSNTGHTGPAFNGGIDWDAEPDKLWALLEYLKTL